MVNSNFQQSKCILVTGGCGYIGSHTCVTLLNSGFEVVVVDNLCNSNADAIHSIEQITGKKVVFYQADLRDKSALDTIFQKHSFAAVLHFAGLKAVGESCNLPLLYYNNNVCGSIVLLEIMQKHNVKRIVFSSSATVYGIPQRLPLDENCRLSTTNPYGSTKLQIETILSDLHASDNEWSITVLRYFNPVGAHQSGLLCESPNGIPNNLTPYIVEVARGNLPYLRVFGNDYDTVDGTGVRDYIHICDLADGHLCALQKATDCGVHIFNLGCGRGYSVLEVVKAFEQAHGIEIPYKIEARRAGDIATSFADPTKANKQLGWSAKYDILDMMKSLPIS